MWTTNIPRRRSARLPIQDRQYAGHDAAIPNVPATRNLSLRAGIRRGSLNLSVFSNNVLNSLPPITVSEINCSSLYLRTLVAAAHDWLDCHLSLLTLSYGASIAVCPETSTIAELNVGKPR